MQKRRTSDRDPSEALAQYVRSTREALGLTQAEAARKAGVSKTTWQQVEWERGERSRNLTLHAMAEALQVDPGVLLSLRDGMSSLAEAQHAGRSREELINMIVRHCQWLRTTDLSLIEQHVSVHAELRRRQRRESRGAEGPMVAEPGDREAAN